MSEILILITLVNIMIPAINYNYLSPFQEHNYFTDTLLDTALPNCKATLCIIGLSLREMMALFLAVLRPTLALCETFTTGQ